MAWDYVHGKPDISKISAAAILSAKNYTNEQLKLSVASLEEIDADLKDYVNGFYPLSGGKLNGDLIITDYGIQVGEDPTGVSISIVSSDNGKTASITKNGYEVATEKFVKEQDYVTSSGKVLSSTFSEKADTAISADKAVHAVHADKASLAEAVEWENINDKPEYFSHVFVKNGNLSSNDLSVIRVSADEYSKMMFNGELKDAALYVVDRENINAYDRPIVHVGRPEQPHHAANKEYSDEKTEGVRNELSAALSTIVYVESGNTVSDRLSVIELSDGEYSEKLVKNELKDDVLYIVDQDRLNAYDERIVNVAEPESPYDAANKYYVDSRLESASGYVV